MKILLLIGIVFSNVVHYHFEEKQQPEVDNTVVSDNERVLGGVKTLKLSCNSGYILRGQVTWSGHWDTGSSYWGVTCCPNA